MLWRGGFDMCGVWRLIGVAVGIGFPVSDGATTLQKHFSNHDVKMVSLCGRPKHEFGIPAINSLLHFRSINIVQSKPSASSSYIYLRTIRLTPLILAAWVCGSTRGFASVGK